MQVKNAKFYADWRDEKGQRKRKAFATAKEARKYQDAMQLEARARKARRMGSVRQLCEAWIEGQTRPAREIWHERTCAADLSTIAGEMPVADLTWMVSNALLERWKHHYSVAVVSALRYRLKNLLAWLEAHGAKDLAKNLPRVPNPQARQIMFEPGDFEKLKAIAPPWFRCFLLLCFDGGLRRGEALRVAPQNYSKELGQITLEVKKRRVQTFQPTDELKQLLAIAPESEDPTVSYLTLLRGKTKPVLYYTVEFWFAKLKKQAGINPLLTSHDLRRTSATQLYLQEKNIGVCQAFLGHANPMTTLRYIVHADNLTLKPMVEKMKVAYTKRTASGSIERSG